MAKKAYIGVNGVARNIPKMYTGAYFGGSAGRTECIVSAAGFILFTFANRNFKKSYAGDAYCASAIVNGWLAPLLVSRTAANVSYSTDGDYTSGPYGPSGTVTFRGATWYVSADGALFQTTANPAGNVIHLNAVTGVSSYSSLAEAALALLNYVNWLPAGDNIARKITKGYIGVNGVARPFFGMPEQLYLYNEGDACTDVTGGWNTLSRSEGGSVTIASSYMRLITPAKPYAGACVCTKNKIDLTYAKAIVMDYAFWGTPINSAIDISADTVTENNMDIVTKSAYVSSTGSNTNIARITLDVSNYSGEYYVKCYTRHSTTARGTEFTIYKMWLE